MTGRWNFTSFAVERVSRKHRKVEPRRGKTGGQCEGEKEKERENGERLELRLTVDFASELIYRDRQHRWSSNGPRDSPLWGKIPRPTTNGM